MNNGDHRETVQGYPITSLGKVSRVALLEKVILEQGGKGCDKDKVLVIARQRMNQLPAKYRQPVSMLNVIQALSTMGLGARGGKPKKKAYIKIKNPSLNGNQKTLGLDELISNNKKIQPKLPKENFYTASDFNVTKDFLDYMDGDVKRSVELVELVSSLRD